MSNGEESSTMDSTTNKSPDVNHAPFAKGVRVELKKAHPCGGRVFLVERVGMDCKLKCESCGAHITLLRRDFDKRLKTILG